MSSRGIKCGFCDKIKEYAWATMCDQCQSEFDRKMENLRTTPIKEEIWVA